MKQLIAIETQQIGEGNIQTVNARDLHEFLGVVKDFSNWMKAQVKRARLVDGIDFVKVTQKGELSRTGQSIIEYHLTLEAGKNISMMSRTDKGDEVRAYFRECEKIALAPAIVLPANYSEALRALADKADQNEALTLQIETDRPKVALAEAITKTTRSIEFKEYAKVISNQGSFIIGRNNLFAWCRAEKILNRENLPYQSYLDNGWFEVRESILDNEYSNGPRVIFTTLITGTGQIGLYNRLSKSPSLKNYLNKDSRSNTLFQMEQKQRHLPV